MKKISLITANGIPESLSNLYYSTSKNPCDVTKITDAIENASSAKEMLTNLKVLPLLRTFSLNKETSDYIRFKGIDPYGNISYLRVSKPKTKHPLNKFLYDWINKNYQTICESDWYEENFNGFEMDDITPEFFMEAYIIPTLESNINYDFNTNIDASKLFY